MPSLAAVGAAATSTGNVTTPLTLNPAVPTHSYGQLLVCFTACRSATPTVATPTGWTSKLNVTGTNGRLAVFTRRVQAGETVAAPAVTWSGLATGTTGSPIGAQVAAFNATADVVDVTGAVANGAASTLQSVGGAAASTVQANALLLTMTTRLDDAGSFTAPATFTIVGQGATTSGSDFSFAWAWKERPVAGSEAAPNFTLTGASSFASSGVMLGFQPLTAVGKSIDLRWNVRSPVAKSADLRWNVQAHEHSDLPVRTSIAAHYRADKTGTTPTDGAGLASLTSGYAAGLNMAQATGVSQPIYRASGANLPNGLPYLELDGANDYMAATGNFDGNNLTLYAVVRLTATGNPLADNQTILGNLAGGGAQWRVATDLDVELMEQGIQRVGTSTDAAERVVQNQWCVLSLTYNAAGAFAFYRNGTLAGSGTFDTTLGIGAPVLGAYGAGGFVEFWTGGIAELALFTAVHSSADHTSNVNYLKTKYGIGGAGTVGKNLDLRWGVRGLAGKNTDARWGVRTRAAAERSLLWAVRGRAAAARDLRWSVRGTAAASRDFRWAVRSRAGVSRDLRWAVRTMAGISRDLRWGVRGRAAAQRSLVWNVRAAVAKLTDARWNVRSRAGVSRDLRWGVRSMAGKNVSLVWNVAASAVVAKATSLAWSVRTMAGKNLDARWAVRSRAGVSRDLRWAVRQAVAKTYDLRWAVRGRAGVSRDLRWSVRSRAGVSRDLRWNVRAVAARAADLRWAVRIAVAKTRDLRWSVRGIAVRASDLRWAVRAAVAKTRDLRWNVRGIARADRDLRWAVRTMAGRSRDLRWAVRAAAGRSTTLLWNVAAPIGTVGKSVTLQWAVRVVARATRDVRWAVRTTVGTSRDLRWSLRGRAGRSADLRWNTRAPVTKTTTLRWGVYSILGRPTDLRWRVHDLAGVSIDLRWNQRATVRRDLELRWKVLTAQAIGEATITFRTSSVNGAFDGSPAESGFVFSVSAGADHGGSSSSFRATSG